MAIRTAKLTLLAFPQSWDGGSLVVRFLCLPKGGPNAVPADGAPSFATANLIFTARLVGSLDELPLTADSVAVGPLVLDRPPLDKAGLFAELATHFNIVEPGLAKPKPKFRKSSTGSYEAIIGSRQRSQYLSDAADYQCVLHEGADEAAPPEAPPPDTVTWGRLMSFALRQPALATALGLMGEAVVPLPADSPDLFARGGWLFIDLDPASDYAGMPLLVAKYAARIPPLAGPRSLFSALLFPVADIGATPVADDAFREAELYDNGMARLVHGSQSEAGDSIQLAWDDEQIAEWFNRQVDLVGADLKSDAPLGVAGYRVDVRRQGDAGWNSLVRVESRGDLSLGAHQLGPFAGESTVEAIPVQVSTRRPDEYWLPSYFCSWRGSSLVLIDEDYRRLHEHPDLQTAEAAPHLLNRDQAFRPVDDKAVPLEYGTTYEFRVRLADLTRGGPAATDPAPDPAGHSVTTIPFRRRKAPGRIQVVGRPSPEDRRVTIAKPRLGYPELLFAGVPFAALEADLAARAADPDLEGKTARELSAPDPDVLSVEIRVDVRTLDGDASLFLPLYTTTRQFAADDDLSIDLAFEDHAVLAAFSQDQAGDGPLVLPTARGIQLTFTALGRETPDYFATEAARRGEPVALECRANAIGEEQDTLLVDPNGVPAVRSFYFQPPADDPSIPRPAERLAQEAALDHTGLQLSGRRGHRTVLGCSAALRQVLSPDSSSIQIASGADLIHRWINIVQLRLQRDWTWDGLDEAGIAVTRTIQRAGLADVVEVVGVVRVPHAVGPKTISGAAADVRAEARQWTDLIFFDAFDPKPLVSPPPPAGLPSAEPPPVHHPSEITVRYQLTATLKGPAPFSVEPAAVRLPVTTPPWQVPRLVSAGLALSPYESAANYSSTQSRRRMLWFEFAEAPIDPDDAYFVRVLAMAPDNLLASMPIPDIVEPALPIDQEWMRLITPGQPRDDNGLRAMQGIAGPSESLRHYLVPLPDGLNESSLELFGFFTYEIRIGHTESRWCTAQGRFGPALRVAGVQHPAPPLVCQVARRETGVLVRAPYATPVYDGRSVRPVLPQTQMWGLLYARVRQADANAWRNVLLQRVQLFAPRLGNDPEGAGARVLFAEGLLPLDDVRRALAEFGLPADAPLTALAAEFLEQPAEEDPLGADLGKGRLLRVSPLVPVPDAC